VHIYVCLADPGQSLSPRISLPHSASVTGGAPDHTSPARWQGSRGEKNLCKQPFTAVVGTVT